MLLTTVAAKTIEVLVLRSEKYTQNNCNFFLFNYDIYCFFKGEVQINCNFPFGFNRDQVFF